MKKILLLDDDRDLRALLGASLTALGLEVLEARRAGDAERLLQQGPVDVAVVDGLLPDGPGLEFVERLRGRDRKVRVVFFSAYYRDLHTFTHLTQQLDVSIVAYKPVEPEGFAAKIAELAGTQASATRGPTWDPHLSTALAELYRQFAQQLPAKIAAVEEEVAAARTDPRRMPRARDLAHALRGSAGAYGFPVVSASMGMVEYLLAEASAQREAWRPYFWEDIRTSLREARSAAARAQPAHEGLEAQDGPP
jgi:DNA-binding response OmpR family regulator